MSGGLTTSQRTKLIAILGMLSSPFDGERSAAGLLASQFLAKAGLGWQDIITGDGPPPPFPPGWHPPPDTAWRFELLFARRHVAALTTWEQEFVTTLARRNRVSPKQKRILTDIAASLRVRGFQ